MNIKEKQNNVRYNVMIIEQVVELLKKKSSFKALSANIIDRYMEKGQFEEEKIKKLVGDTGIERACFTGEKRFLIPDCEEDILKNPLILDNIYNINTTMPHFMASVAKTVESFKRNELIADENLERLIYYVANNQSIEGYWRKRFDLRQLCAVMENINIKDINESDMDVLQKFIQLSEEKVILAKAALIVKNMEQKRKND